MVEADGVEDVERSDRHDGVEAEQHECLVVVVPNAVVYPGTCRVKRSSHGMIMYLVCYVRLRYFEEEGRGDTVMIASQNTSG